MLMLSEININFLAKEIGSPPCQNILASKFLNHQVNCLTVANTNKYNIYASKFHISPAFSHYKGQRRDYLASES